MFIMRALLHIIIKSVGSDRSLVTRAKCTCNVNLLPEEINEIKKFGSWNGFPKTISTSVITGALNKSINDNHTD